MCFSSKCTSQSAGNSAVEEADKEAMRAHQSTHSAPQARSDEFSCPQTNAVATDARTLKKGVMMTADARIFRFDALNELLYAGTVDAKRRSARHPAPRATQRAASHPPPADAVSTSRCGR